MAFLSHGFPNLFHMGPTQTGLARNFTYMLECKPPTSPT